MNYYVRSCDGFLAKAYARVKLPPPDAEAPPSYMSVEKRWSEEKRKRVEIVTWVGDRCDATSWSSEEDAWAAFDRSGHGRREDYVVEPL